MHKLFQMRSMVAISMLLLTLIASGCKSPPTGKQIVLLNGRHARAWSKADAAKIPALADQAALCKGWVYVATDTGWKMMYDLDIKPPDAYTNMSMSVQSNAPAGDVPKPEEDWGAVGWEQP